MRRASAIVAVTLAAFSWVAALIAAPAAAASSGVSSAVIYAAGSLVCHQRPERSFHRGGAQLPVCARCLGLYAGGLAGTVAWAGLAGLGTRASMRAHRLLRSRHVRLALIVLGLPAVVSIATAWLGWWDGGNGERALLALPLGAAIGGLVSAVAAGDLR